MHLLPPILLLLNLLPLSLCQSGDGPYDDDDEDSAFSYADVVMPTRVVPSLRSPEGLGQFTVVDFRHGGRQHGHEALRDGRASGCGLTGYVDHVGLTGLIQMREFAHEASIPSGRCDR